MANLSNINNILRVSSSGVGINKNNTGPSELDIESAGADMIDMTRTGQKTYRFAISGASAFSLFDVAANADRLVIDSSGNSTFAGNITGVRGFFNSGATNVVATFTSADGTATLQCADSAGNVEFGASGNNFVVQPAGGVAQLTVGASSSTFAGNVTVNNSGDGKITIGGVSGLEIIHNNAGNTIAEIKQLYASTSNSAQMKLTSGFTTFHTGTSGTERMRIDSSGNVGIGKSQSGNAVLTARSSAGGNTGIILIEGDTTNDGWGMYAVTANEYRITRFTNGSYSDKFIIDSSGNATFAGNVKVNLTSSVAGAISVFDADGNTIWLKGRSSDGESSVSFRNNADSAYNGRIATTDTLMKFSQASDYTFDGNVGIGTASPSQKLHVVGKGLFTDDIQLSQTNPRIDYGNSTAGALRFWSVDENSEKMRITSGGNVGIGTTSPQSKLHVNGGGINLEQGGQLTERTTGVEASAAQNTWYAVHTFNIYELTLFFLLVGFEDDLGDGNNKTAVFVDSGTLSYGSGFAPTRLSGSTSIEARRAGQELQIRFTHTAGGSNRQLRWSLITVTGN